MEWAELIKRCFLSLLAMALATGVPSAAGQTAGAQSSARKIDAPALDTIVMSNVITKRTGVVTLAAVRPRGPVYDIEIRFGGPLKDYRGAMSAVVAAVGESSKKENYDLEWCYILTHEIGREQILVSDIRETQTLALSGKRDEAWTYFESKKTLVSKVVK